MICNKYLSFRCLKCQSLKIICSYHTVYCSKKFNTFNQVSNNESEQRNFTHLIRCQPMKVKPCIILNHMPVIKHAKKACYL